MFASNPPSRVVRPCRRPMLGLLIVVGLMLAPLSLAPAQTDDGVKQVVYHVDFKDPRRFSALLTSVSNMVRHYQDAFVEADVRLVFNSFGVRFLTDDPLEGTPFAAGDALQERRETLKGRLNTLASVYGVQLELCGITRSQVGLAKDAVYDGVTFVPSGVVRVAELQDQGFAYIKVE